MNEYIKKIKELLDQEKYQAAYQLCIKLINADPENTQALRLKRKIESKVEKENHQKVDIEIERLKPLWKEQRYKDIILKLQELQQYTPNYTYLQKLLAKANKKANELQQEQTEQFITQNLDEARNFASQNQFDQALLKELPLKKFIATHPKIQDTFTKIRHQYIDHQLAQKNTLLESEQYKDIVSFLETLIPIDPNYTRLQKLIAQQKSRYFSVQKNQKREYIFQGLENLKTLYQKNKFDKVIKGTKEILLVDPQNTIAKKYLKKSIKHQEKIMDQELAAQIQKRYHEFLPLYKNDKSKFVKA